MSVSLVVETPPAAEPVSVALAKSHMRVSLATDDALIGVYLQAARELYEGITSRSIVNKGYRQVMDAFPYYVDGNLSMNALPPDLMNSGRNVSTLFNNSQQIKLLRWPLVSVTRIDYFSSADSTWHYLYPAPGAWMPKTEFVKGDQITDGTNLQQVTAVSEQDEDGTSVSGPTVPGSPWGSAMSVGDTTVDGDLTWTVKQTPAPAGDFMVVQDDEPPRLYPNVGLFWPPVLYIPGAVRIHFVAGYGDDSSAAPSTAKVAIMQTVANWYQNREPVSSPELKKIPHGLEDLYWIDRVIDFAPTRG